MIHRRESRRWLTGFALCAALVILSVAFIDRPVAEFFEANVRHTGLWNWLNRILGPFRAVPVLGILFLIGCGCRKLSGRAFPAWTSGPVICCWSSIGALAAEFLFKQIFGRGWPEPTYLGEHLYGFRFLRASVEWNSFPSGTATIAAAIAVASSLIAPRTRRPGFALAAFLCVAVVAVNAHWLSDVIAGAFLGAAIGRVTVLLFPQALVRNP